MELMSATLTYELEKLKAKFPGYDFTATLKESVSELDPMQIVKTIVSKLKADYDKVDISLPSETYDAIAVIRVKSKPRTYNLAWYQNNSVGYVGDSIFYNIENDIKNNVDFRNIGMRVDSYIDNCRQLEYYIYY